MELTQLDLLEELLAPRRDNNWTTFHDAANEIFPNGWNFDSFDEIPDLSASSSSLLGLISPADSNFACPPLGEPYPLVDFSIVPESDSLYPKNEILPIPVHQECRGVVQSGELCMFSNYQTQSSEDGIKSSCDIQTHQGNSRMELSGEKKCKSKKLEGQPSKNLMAERRRRKRLNDRLSMLRSIVPKISKTDRTSILADTIDYMKELQDKVHEMGEKDTEEDNNQMFLKGSSLRKLKPNEQFVRNPSKFDVERRDQNTRIEISCATKPGLLLSTVCTLEALGLDIQQCVISSFSDFSLQASCFETAEHRTNLSSEDVKQALFQNAGYGGRCL